MGDVTEDEMEEWLLLGIPPIDKFPPRLIRALERRQSKPTDVTALRIKDVTGALRARRYRQRKNGSKTNAGVTVDAHAVTVITKVATTAISTPEMCALAARIGDGRASREDLQLAERLIMALVDRLPPDMSIDINGDAS